LANLTTTIAQKFFLSNGKFLDLRLPKAHKL
jgi:hypothetical protein